MKKTTVIGVLCAMLFGYGCDASGPEAPQANNANVPTTADIEKARAEAAQSLPSELTGLSSYAQEPLSLPVTSTPADQGGGVEVQSQAISWGCRIAYYPQPWWWQGVFALQALKSLGVLTDKATCKWAVSGIGTLTAFLGEKGQEKYLAVLTFIAVAGGNCACDYVY
jgi:hypothetical protein